MEDDRCLFGVKFEEISEEDKPYLEQYIQSLDQRA